MAGIQVVAAAARSGKTSRLVAPTARFCPPMVQAVRCGWHPRNEPPSWCAKCRGRRIARLSEPELSDVRPVCQSPARCLAAGGATDGPGRPAAVAGRAHRPSRRRGTAGAFPAHCRHARLSRPGRWLGAGAEAPGNLARGVAGRCRPAVAGQRPRTGQLYRDYQRVLNEHQLYDPQGRFWSARAASRGPDPAVRGTATRVRRRLRRLHARSTRSCKSSASEDYRSRSACRWRPTRREQSCSPRARQPWPNSSGATYYVAIEQLPPRPHAVAAMAHVERSLFANPRAIPSTRRRGLEIVAAAGVTHEVELLARRIKKLLVAGDSADGVLPVRPADILVVFPRSTNPPSSWCAKCFSLRHSDRDRRTPYARPRARRAHAAAVVAARRRGLARSTIVGSAGERLFPSGLARSPSGPSCAGIGSHRPQAAAAVGRASLLESIERSLPGPNWPRTIRRGRDKLIEPARKRCRCCEKWSPRSTRCPSVLPIASGVPP